MAEASKTGRKRRGAAMPETELHAILQEEVRSADNWAASVIRDEQEKNLRYYLGMPLGNEIEGRSQVRSLDVFEIVESAMPSFIEPFFAGDAVGEFLPRGPEDDAYAAQATDVVNYIIKDRNPGFLIFNTWFKDALLSKVGVIRAEWEETPPKRFEFESLTDDQMAMLAQDAQAEIIEHSERVDEAATMQRQQQAAQMAQQQPQDPQQAQALQMQLQALQQPVLLHDVTVLQKQPGEVKIHNVRPENFLVSRGAADIETAPLVGELVTYTRSDITEMGHDGDNVADFDTSAFDDGLRELRDHDTRWQDRVNSTDRSMEEVTLFRGFIRVDFNGDGVAEWRKVLASGDAVLDNEEAEWQDYCLITPIPIPHRVIGQAYADPARSIEEINTTLHRQYFDSLYAANNPRTYVNSQANVNLDDLLNNRIGGVIRGDGPMANAIAPLTTTIVSRDALEGIQLAQTMRERRLGITAYNQGLDTESLNKTATGVKTIMAAADKRQLMTLRIFAETGVKSLFRLVLRIITKYQDQPGVARLRNQWVSYDPRGWNPDMDVTIEVGIGSGDKTETLMMLQQFGTFMAAAETKGLVTPQNWYEFGKTMAKNGKLKGAELKYLSDPSQSQPKPPAPDPEQVKAQARMQELQFKAEQDQQKFQAEQQTQLAIDQNRQEWEAKQKQLELQQTAELEQYKASLSEQLAAKDREFNAWKAQLEAGTKIQIAQMGTQPFVDAETEKATVAASTTIVEALTNNLQVLSDNHAAAQAQTIAAMQDLALQITRPKTVVRDAAGKVLGIQ